jgi:hypothetical protein
MARIDALFKGSWCRGVLWRFDRVEELWINRLEELSSTADDRGSCRRLSLKPKMMTEEAVGGCR